MVTALRPLTVHLVYTRGQQVPHRTPGLLQRLTPSCIGGEFTELNPTPRQQPVAGVRATLLPQECHLTVWARRHDQRRRCDLPVTAHKNPISILFTRMRGNPLKRDGASEHRTTLIRTPVGSRHPNVGHCHIPPWPSFAAEEAA